MIDFIIQKAGGGTISLYNKNSATLSTVTSAEQTQGLNSDDIVRITVESAVKITFDIGDKMNVLGRWYKINRLPTVKKTGNRLFTYNIELEGVQYDLARVVYDLTIDTTSNALQDVQADMLTGNLQRFATVLIANANRVFPGKWVLGDFPAGTEDKTLVFGETDNCLLVLQRLCSEYNTEFEIIQAGDVNTLHFRKAGQIYPYTFEYGKGKGLYSLERLNVSTSNIVTRLKVYGGTRNITAKYRAARLCLPGKTKGQSYIQKTGPANNYGIWEATKIFEHIYPKRTGTVTAIDSGNVLKLTDSTMNFDLNEKEADGITTKYLIDGSPAKIHFNTGNLSGYEFEIQSYDHATKTFTLKPFEDERGERFPSEKSSAFKFAVNDKYVLLDIALPQSYIDDAEEQLAEEGGIYYDQNSQPKVQYSLEVAEEFLKELSGAGSITNIFSVGDYIPVKDADIDVDKSVRVQSFTRDLLNPFSYKLNISDTVTTNITNRVISELIEIDKITKINDIKSQVKARRDWRSAQELLDMVFDTEGDYYSEKIKPNSIETSMLAVGAKSTQFGLVGTVIQANYNGNKNSVNVKGGTLSHYAIEESGRNWTLADGTTTLTGDSTPYYIYAKCQKVGTAGSIIFSTSKITVEQDPLFYHFFVGVVNSVDPTLNVRSVALTYGFTTVNGKFIRTGRIQSNDGLTYFDLDLGEIGGKITFRSTGGTDEDLAEILDGVGSDIQDAQAAANAAALLAQQAIDDAEANVGLINTEVSKLQAQIDGEVSNWFYPYTPTLANYPASDWTTNEIKDRHIGDTFTNTQTFVDNATTPDAGKSWRFVKNGSTYSWTLIADSDAVKALLKAAEAQATADGKSTTFLIQPTSYKLGDMWVLNADRTVNGTAYKQGEILTATQDSTTFNEAHWLKRVRYTDDTAVNNLEIGGRNLILNSLNRIGFWSNYTSTSIQDQAVSGENYRRFRRTYPEGITDNRISTYTNEFFTPEKSGYYTYSTYFRPNEFDIELRLYFGGIYGAYTLCKANEWTQVSVTAWIEAGVATRLGGVWGEMPPEAVQWIDYNRVSVTSGNKPMDWTPAPEDVQVAIDAAVVKATYWSIKASSPVIYKDAINADTSGAHTTVIVSGELRSGTTTTQGGFITVTPNGGTEAGTASASPVTIAPTDSDGKTSYTVKLYDTASKTTLLDTMTIPVVFKGASGVNAISAVLSNEADVLPASPEGVVSDYSGSGTDIIVYEGGTRLTYGTGNGQFQVSASGSGISVGSASTVSGNIRRYANASNMTSDNATIVFTITGKTADGTSFSLTKTQSFAKSKTGQKGDTGASAPLLYLSASAQVMKCNPDNTPQTGQTVSIEAKLQNVSGTATFVATPYNDAGTALTAITLGGSGNTRTLTNTQWLATYKRIEVVATLGSLTDKVTIYRVADGATGATGQNAIVGLLTNESVTLQANNAGVVSSFTPANGEFWVYNGATKVTSGITFSKVSETGCTAAITSAGVYSVSAMSADNATVVFRAVYSGVTIDKVLTLSKSRAGADGVSITLVDVEFAKNTNPTTAPTTGWATTAPTLAEGEQLWTRTKTAYSSGNPTYSTPANITPKTGATGTGIDSVTEEFAISTSKTTQPTTGWSTTQPTWVQGQYIWSRVKVVYKNPASTVYTGYAVSSEWEAVNELEIGGRNLFRNTINLFSANWQRVSNYEWENIRGITAISLFTFAHAEGVESGQTYTLSFEIRASNSDIQFTNSTLYINSSTSTSHNRPELIEDKYIKVFGTFVYQEGTGNVHIYLNNMLLPGDVSIRNIKVVKGNKSTDWTPAPEDVQAEIDDAKQEALTAAGNAQNTANSLKDFTDTAFRNGIIDRSESIAIEKYKNSLNEAMAKAEASYNKVYTNTYLESTAKTNLLNAKINLWGQRDALLSAINTAISGGTTTPAQKTAVDNAFNTFNSLMSAFQNALEEANKAIQNKLKSFSDEAKDAADDAAAIAADAQAKANISKAVTDKFRTTIDGGLISTVMVLLRELNSQQDTAGISGIQGALKNQPAFWSGGKYEQAIGLIEFLHHMSEGTPPGTGEGQFDYQAKYQQLAPVAILHNGAAKVGDFLVLESGRIAMIDPSTGIPRLVFSVTDLPLIEDLISEIEDTGTVSNDSQNNVRGSYIFPNGINIEKNDSRLRFVLNWNSYLYVDGGDWGADGMVSFVLLRNGVYYDLISEFYALADPYETASEQLYTVKDFESLPAGYYTVQAIVQDLSGMDAVWADIGSSQLTYYFKLQGVRRQQYGRDGMMFFYSNRHFHFTEGKGLDAKELDPKAWNTPGVLLSASVNSVGGSYDVWGAKQSTTPAARNSTGRYTVYHTIGHTKYQVVASPRTANMSYHIVSRGTTSFVIEWRTIGSSPALSDTAFDFQITGNNYN